MIEVRDLTKRYGATRALDALSFDVAEGRVTGFLGPNGSGKSTTMRIALGLDRADRGTVHIGGRPLRAAARPLTEVGALLDAGEVHPGRRVHHHLWALAASNRLPRRRVDEVLGLVGLADLAGRRVGGLSLGTRQRLGIAAAMLGDPHTLLFDEPNNGLDPTGIRWMRTFMGRLAAEGRTVLVSSHLLGEMSLVAHDLVVISSGRLVHQGPTASFLAAATRRRVIVRTTEPSRLTSALAAAGGRVALAGEVLEVAELDAGAVGAAAQRLGIALQELRTDDGTLEDVFLDLTR